MFWNKKRCYWQPANSHFSRLTLLPCTILHKERIWQKEPIHIFKYINNLLRTVIYYRLMTPSLKRSKFSEIVGNLLPLILAIFHPINFISFQSHLKSLSVISLLFSSSLPYDSNVQIMCKSVQNKFCEQLKARLCLPVRYNFCCTVNYSYGKGFA